MLPDGNQAPSVNIDSPTAGLLFFGRANILIDTVATDSDGIVSKVELFGYGALLGTGTFTTQSQYSFTWSNVFHGSHSLYAIVYRQFRQGHGFNAS